ncbi:MAG: hypothetical protein ABEJ05_02555 [Haloglomus sp.]
MSAELAAGVASVLTTAALLGVTHAVEPDHVAGITALTGRYADARRSALAGACFSLGHVALVVGWLVVVALVGQTALPAVLGPLGTVGAALLLGAVGAGMAAGGLRTLAGNHARTHTDDADPHLHLPLAGRLGLDADHSHGARAYLRTGVVGALFTLSPPLSMLALTSALFGQYGGRTVALAIAGYAVAITVTMGLVGAGAGATLDHLGGRPRLRGGVRALAGGLATALAVAMLAGSLPALA